MSQALSPLDQPVLLKSHDPEGTALVLVPRGSRLPRIAWLGASAAGVDAVGANAAIGAAGPSGSVVAAAGRALSILPEVDELWFGLPGLTGHRLGENPGLGGQTTFCTLAISGNDSEIVVESEDRDAGLALRTRLEVVSGGPIRIQHTLTNAGDAAYVVNTLDVTVPIDERAGEILDLTGRWGRERMPQRHPIADGVWLRESRTGKPGAESVTMLTAGFAGFGFGSGSVWGAHLAWSGNSRHFIQRQASGVLTLGAGELLLPGEMVLAPGQSYETPWLFLGASEAGLDGLAQQYHRYLRSLSAHPTLPRPVVANVWEAVYFDHDLTRLKELADRAAEVGIERFVLDDGWFGSRRHDRAGLGDWVVSNEVWPEGLNPIIEYVEALGMQFGLWFEPEMINKDSELYRAHPDWILGHADQALFRNQLVLDLGRVEVREHLLTQMQTVLSQHRIRYVKWDHNRPLADAASGARGGAAGIHQQTVGFYALLDELRRLNPGVEWESCSSGGARIDLAVLQRVERVWTSDMTDALSRQLIQRWTGQLLPPEYLGAHVSANQNHQTARVLPLDFRAATAFFGDFGVEWDVTSATQSERDRLAQWISAYKQHRLLLHTGRVIRVDLPCDQRLIYGVVAEDRSEAIFAYVQLDEAVHDPEPFVLRGLDSNRTYTSHQILAAEAEVGNWRGEDLRLSGAVLERIGLPAPGRRPISAMLVHLMS